MAKRRMGIMVFLLCFCLHMMPCYVQAASTADATEPVSTQKECSLVISYGCEGKLFSELPVELYKIGEMSADYQYTLTSSFDDSGLVLNGIQSVKEWNVIRSTLEIYILANHIKPDFTTVTDSAGQACFEALNPGVYLAATEHVMQDNWTYIFDSALVALPGLGMDGLWQYQVAVNSKSKVIPPMDTDEEIAFKVTKLWKGDTGTDRPQNIEVEIFCNGAIYQTVILSEENCWTYSWKAKEDGASWKVVERNIPSGYTMTVEERGTSFVLTNTLIREKPEIPTPPQTGDTSNILLYIILMNVSGILLVILGIIGKRKRHEKSK